MSPTKEMACRWHWTMLHHRQARPRSPHHRGVIQPLSDPPTHAISFDPRGAHRKVARQTLSVPPLRPALKGVSVIPALRFQPVDFPIGVRPPNPLRRAFQELPQQSLLESLSKSLQEPVKAFQSFFIKPSQACTPGGVGHSGPTKAPLGPACWAVTLALLEPVAACRGRL